jgi:hypothetical protein
MVNNDRGVVALAVILSMLMVIGAIGVFGFVSGRLGTTYKLSRRPQAILDAESASYVTYMLMRDGLWSRGDSKTVQLLHKNVGIEISNTGDNKIQATSPYK